MEQNITPHTSEEDSDELMIVEHGQKRYITLEDGMDFRTIAKKMTAAGFKMNHATARNVLMSALNNFIGSVTTDLCEGMAKPVGVSLEEAMKEQMVHEALSDLLWLANEKRKAQQ